MTTKRGGSGRGQGRKPIKQGEYTVTVSLRLTTSQRAKLADLGGASWVRQQIEGKKMKVRISYQHVTGHSGYDREWIGEGETLASAKEAAIKSAKAENPYIKIPELMFWDGRVAQGDGMVAVMYDF